MSIRLWSQDFERKDHINIFSNPFKRFEDMNMVPPYQNTWCH